MQAKTKFKSFKTIEDAFYFCSKLTFSRVRWFSGIRYSCYIKHDDGTYSCKKKMLFTHTPCMFNFSSLRNFMPAMSYLTSYVVKYYEI